jgi:hypothetical protein
MRIPWKVVILEGPKASSGDFTCPQRCGKSVAEAPKRHKVENRVHMGRLYVGYVGV